MTSLPDGSVASPAGPLDAAGAPASSPTLTKVERAKAQLCGLDLEPRLAELAAAGWDQLDEETLTIHLKWLGIFFRPVTPGRFMVRLRLPGGVIRADQLAVLAEAVDRCGEHGSADITTRQNLQLRGLLLEDMPPLLADDAPRNLPRKFNVAVGGAPDSFLLHNDLAFLPAHHRGELGFTVMVGGFFSGQRNELAIPLGLWLRSGELVPFTLAVLRHYERGGPRAVRTRCRLMYFIDELGLETYRQQVLESYGDFAGPDAAAAVPHHDGTHLVNRAPRDVCGIHAQKQPGLHWAGLHVPMGRLDAEAMGELARLAK
ncbi:MAG: ferredoxin--nitrite reductase, partial [Synechococcaceae cyanobacterium]|nr:ferredoxin--nitrite reductase [Synechococcaceae cyanobacterium]